MKRPKSIDLPTAFFCVAFAPPIFIFSICWLASSKFYISSDATAYLTGFSVTLIATVLLMAYAGLKNRFDLVSLHAVAVFNLAVILLISGDSNVTAIITGAISLTLTFLFGFKLQNQERQPSDGKIYLFILALIVSGSAINFITRLVWLHY